MLADINALAQIAYEAYAEHQGWKNVAGLLIPAWEVVREDIKDAWVAAVEAVFDVCEDAEAE